MQDTEKLWETCQVVCNVSKKAPKAGATLHGTADTDSSCKQDAHQCRSCLATALDCRTCSTSCMQDTNFTVSALVGAQPGQQLSADSQQSQPNSPATEKAASTSSKSCGSPGVEALLLELGHEAQHEQQQQHTIMGSAGRPAADVGVQAVTHGIVPATPLPQTPDAQSLRSSSAAFETQQSQQPGPGTGAAMLKVAQDDTDAGSSAASVAPGTSLFFARVPPTVEVEDIRSLFERFGKVLDLNLFRPWATAKTSKGCGIVVYETIADCVAAMNSLHNRHHWTGGETTMVVEWADPSRQRKENPDAKGVFEAKHKSQTTCGSRSRYRSQMMKRVFALGLQGGGCPPVIPGILNTLPGMNSNSTNTPLPMASRGVLAMAPQLAGCCAAVGPGPGQVWGMGSHQVPAVQPAGIGPAFAAGATTRAQFGQPLSSAAAASASSFHQALVPGPLSAGGLLPPGLSSLLPCQDMQVQGHTATLVDTAQHQDYCYAATLAGLAAAGSKSVPSLTPNHSTALLHASPASVGAWPVLPNPGLRPVLTSPLLPLQQQQQQQQQQSAHVLSRLGPAGTARLMGEGCSSACGTPSCMQQHCSFDALVQQQLQLQQPESLTYLSASAGLVADASMVAAAAAACVPQALHPAGAQDCHTPLCCHSESTAGVVGNSSHMAYPSAGVDPAPHAAGELRPQHWLLRRPHASGSSSSLPGLVANPAGMPGLAGWGSTGNLATMTVAATAGVGSVRGTPVRTPTWEQHGPGAAQMPFNPVMLSNAGSEVNSFLATATGGWA